MPDRAHRAIPEVNEGEIAPPKTALVPELNQLLLHNNFSDKGEFNAGDCRCQVLASATLDSMIAAKVLTLSRDF
jgi:hypothetical protein